MPINPEMVNSLLNDALQELSEINKERVKLEGLIAYLREYLNKSVRAICTDEIYDKQPSEIVGMGQLRVARFRRKESHATKIATIVKDSREKLKIRNIINKYPDYGWSFKNPKNAFNQVYRTISDRKDLFVYTEDKFVLLKNHEQGASAEV
jgi:hypothetical protein